MKNKLFGLMDLIENLMEFALDEMFRLGYYIVFFFLDIYVLFRLLLLSKNLLHFLVLVIIVHQLKPIVHVETLIVTY
jgi:hypothetical protein